MSELETIKSLKKQLQLLEDCYTNKKGFIVCWQLKELFYNDEKKKRYNWLTIIQLTGLKYTAEEIGKIIGYSASTVENEKNKIVEVIENMNEWGKPLLIIADFIPTEAKTTPIIREFAKQYEAPIIVLMESLGLKSYISIGEHIVEQTKMLFNLDCED